MKRPIVEEFLASQQRCFIKGWPVDEDYRIDDGIVRPLKGGGFVQELSSSREAAEWYYPMSHPELPAELAKLADSSNEEVLQFVKRYGLLGYQQVAESSPFRHSRLEYYLRSAVEQEIPVVSPKHALDFGTDKALGLGDPVDWILIHASTVKMVLEIAGALNNRASLNRQIEGLVRREPYYDEYGEGLYGEGLEDVLRFEYAQRENRRKIRYNYYAELIHPHEAAMQVIHTVLDSNLVGVFRRIPVVSDTHEDAAGKRIKTSELESVFEFQSLLDCIYWLLADSILGDAKIRKCLFCHRYFIAVHGKMKFCPPRKGFRGSSPCANNYRVRKFRRKEKRAEGRAAFGKSKGAGRRLHTRKSD